VLAQVALPGDALYGWKPASEQIWRAVHFNPLQAELLLANRRVDELTRVAGDLQAESLARQREQQSLDTLTGYTSPNSREFISAALIEQKEDLVQAGVSMPELDRFLTYLGVHEARLQLDNKVTVAASGIVTYTLTLSNTGPTSPVSATLATQLAPTEKLVSLSQAACGVAAQGTVSCPVNGLTTEQPYRLLLTTPVDRCNAGGSGGGLGAAGASRRGAFARVQRPVRQGRGPLRTRAGLERAHAVGHQARGRGAHGLAAHGRGGRLRCGRLGCVCPRATGP